MTPKVLPFLVAMAIGCGGKPPDGRGNGIPTLTIVDTSFASSGNWHVMGADVDSSGVVFIADFSRLGVYVRGPSEGAAHVFGRAGDGPGEFRYLLRLRRCGSEILAYDFVHSRLTAVTQDGFGQEEQLPTALLTADFVGCDAAGRRYFTKMVDDRVSPGRQIRSIRLLRYVPPGEAIDSVAVLPGIEIFVSNRWHAFRDIPFGLKTFVAIGPSGPLYAESSKLELTSIEETGDRRTLYSQELGERTVTARDRELYLEERLEVEPDSAARLTLRRVLAEAEWASRIPQLDRLIAGQDGTIWVRRTPAADDTAASWLAVASNGHDAETLLLPRAARVMSAGKGFLTIVDELPSGEERVMVVRVTRNK